MRIDRRRFWVVDLCDAEVDNANIRQSLQHHAACVKRCRFIYGAQWASMMVTVKAFANQKQSQKPVVPSFIARAVDFRSNHVPKRIDRPSDVMKQRNAQASSPQKAEQCFASPTQKMPDCGRQN